MGEILRVRTTTGEALPGVSGPGSAGEAGDAKEGETPATPAGKVDPAGKAEKVEKKEERPLLRGLVLPRDNEKPILVYFHWPHEDGDRGKRIVKFCSGPLDDEAFVKVAPLFHCIEVNTRDSEEKLVAEAKVAATPALLVCAPDGTIVWRSEDPKLSGKVLAAALRRVVEAEFPERWERIAKEMKSQAESLKEGKAHAAQKKWEEAAFSFRWIVGSDVRFTEEWAEARRLLVEADRKLEEKAAKEAAK